MRRFSSFFPPHLFSAQQDEEELPGLALAGHLDVDTPGPRRAQRHEQLSRRWAASLLITGAGCGFLAFGLATVLGMSKQGEADRGCFDQRPCASGYKYVPETVSEMVSQPGDPAGKLFQSFSVIASLCIFISRYPWELRNVYTAQTADCSLAGVRTFIIPVGMLLVAWVPVVPRPQRTVRDAVAANIHSFGAFCFVLGYMVVEAATLCRLRKRLPLKELRWRWLAVLGILLCTLTFAVSGSLLGHAELLRICCLDQWVDLSEAFAAAYGNVTDPLIRVELELVKMQYGHKVLNNTAHGLAFVLKNAEFWSETGAGVCILLSHALIWCFCQERHIRVSGIEPL